MLSSRQEAYPTVVQEYLATFPAQEVPKVVNRLLVWAVRYQRACSATDLEERRRIASLRRARSLGPSKCLEEEEDRDHAAAKAAGIVYGDYPSWWGHEEHKPTNAASHKKVQPQRTSTSTSTGDDRWMTQKKQVDESTQTLGLYSLTRPTSFLNESEAIHGFEHWDEATGQSAQQEDSVGSARSRRSQAADPSGNSETSRNNARPQQPQRPVRQPNMVFGGKPHNERRRMERTENPPGALFARVNEGGNQSGSPLSCTVDLDVLGPVSQPVHRRHEARSVQNSKSNTTSANVAQRHRNDAWQGLELSKPVHRPSRPAALSARTERPEPERQEILAEEDEPGVAAIVSRFLNSPFLECLDDLEETASDSYSNIYDQYLSTPKFEPTHANPRTAVK